MKHSFSFAEKWLVVNKLCKQKLGILPSLIADAWMKPIKLCIKLVNIMERLGAAAK